MANAPTELDIEAAHWFYQNAVDVFVLIRSGKIDRINPAWTELTDWSVEETLGRPISDFVPPDDKAAVDEVAAGLRRDGHAKGEHRITHRDGSILWVRTRAKRGPDEATIVVLEDVTEERRQQTDRNDAERANEMLRESGGIMFWRFDPETGLYDVDPDLSRPGGKGIVGNRRLTADEMTGEVHPDDRRRMSKAFGQTLQTGEPLTLEYRHVTDEGWARLRTSWRGLRQLESGAWLVLGLTQDVTEVAEARDAALAAGEAKAQFLANMSHEIRTPMNGVLGVLHLLKNEPLSRDARNLLDEAVGCGHMLSELLNDVIDFSRIEAGRLEMSPEPIDPAALLDSVAGLLRPQAEASGLWLRVEAQQGLGWASIDPVRLRQILFNLIGNAVKFTLSGGVEVRLLRVHRDGAPRLRFEVADTGVGISQEARATLFQRFHQADGSTTRRFGGSGLGLAISQRLVELMDGEIGMDSLPGVGSTFWVEIASPEVAQPDIRPIESGALLEGLRVLVVEDNPTNRLIATRMLEQLGAQVQTADDGRQGLEAVSRAVFDLIFMDVQMPIMDGVEATRLIRAMPGAAGVTPILAMTANALAHQARTYLAAGMNGVVSKPLSPTALVAQIAALFDEPEQQDVAASA
ncbi:MAG: ATP-binding protein [Pseudomonadota bacterium]